MLAEENKLFLSAWDVLLQQFWETAKVCQKYNYCDTTKNMVEHLKKKNNRNQSDSFFVCKDVDKVSITKFYCKKPGNLPWTAGHRSRWVAACSHTAEGLYAPANHQPADRLAAQLHL